MESSPKVDQDVILKFAQAKRGDNFNDKLSTSKYLCDGESLGMARGNVKSLSQK